MSATKTRLLAVVALLVTFVAGIVVGVFSTHLMRLYHMKHGVPAGIAEMMLKRLDHKLDLTPAQHAQVAAILHRHHRRINALVTGTRPAIHQEIEEANAEILRVLTPKQRVEYEKMKIRLHGMVEHHP